jgi:predicted nucleic acid-binding protein
LLALDLAAKYRLKCPDAIHLATAVIGGADRFLTNNHRDFSETVEEIDVIYPQDLPG